MSVTFRIKEAEAFRFEDSEDHVTELASAEINALHELICVGDSENGCCQALFSVRRTIKNGWSRDALRRRRNAIRRDSVKVEERQGGEMTGYPYSAPCSYSLICHQKFREQLTVGFK